MKSEKNSKSIIYVNFAPYENAGKILDFILNRFTTVIVYSFNFHRLSPDQKPSRLTIYKQGKQIYWTKLFQTPTTVNLAFILLPIRSIVLFLQLVFHGIRLRKKYGKPDLFFTVNAFTAWCGNFMKKYGLVNETIFWVWDYYPPVHESKMVMFMRWLYWQFDKPAAMQADRIVFLNRHLKNLRQEIGVLPKHGTYPIVGIGTNPTTQTIKIKLLKTSHLVFLGVLKRIQGLDIFFDSAKGLALYNPNIILHVIGGGPDLDYYRKRASSCPLTVIFHGYIKNEKAVDAIIRKCSIGIAPYVPDKSNCIYYSDPSKIKRYLNFGLPVITTDVFDFSKDIARTNAGIVIPYGSRYFINAVKIIHKRYRFYRENAQNLAKKYTYTRLYKKIFE